MSSFGTFPASPPARLPARLLHQLQIQTEKQVIKSVKDASNWPVSLPSIQPFQPHVHHIITNPFDHAPVRKFQQQRNYTHTHMTPCNKTSCCSSASFSSALLLSPLVPLRPAKLRPRYSSQQRYHHPPSTSKAKQQRYIHWAFCPSTIKQSQRNMPFPCLSLCPCPVSSRRHPASVARRARQRQSDKLTAQTAARGS